MKTLFPPIDFDAFHREELPRRARRTLYVHFYHPAVFGGVEAGTGFNDVISEQDAVVTKARPETPARDAQPAPTQGGA